MSAACAEERRALATLDRRGGRWGAQQVRTGLRDPSALDRLVRRGCVERQNGHVSMTDAGLVELFRLEGAEEYRGYGGNNQHSKGAR